MPETINEKQRLEWFVNYFQTLSNDKEQQDFEWHLGLHIAKRLLYISNSNSDDLSELKLLIKVLETGKENFGSGWMDLYFHANSLLDKVLNKSKL